MKQEMTGRQRRHLDVHNGSTFTSLSSSQMLNQDRLTPVYRPVFQDNPGKPAPEWFSHSGY